MVGKLVDFRLDTEKKNGGKIFLSEFFSLFLCLFPCAWLHLDFCFDFSFFSLYLERKS